MTLMHLAKSDVGTVSLGSPCEMLGGPARRESRRTLWKCSTLQEREKGDNTDGLEVG